MDVTKHEERYPWTASSVACDEPEPAVHVTGSTSECLDTPPHLQQDLLDHILGAYKAGEAPESGSLAGDDHHSNP